jgi:molybdate transport system substrate-binding protein
MVMMGLVLVVARRALLGLTAAAFVLAQLALPVRAQTKDILVFGAASLKNALDEANALYLRRTSKKAVVSYGASSALARQIESGAPADVFISADLDWMDYLAQRNLIKPATRSNFLGNTLVLVAPADSKVTLTIARNFPLAQALGGGRLAMADPASVPAGKYGKAALEALGVWASVAAKIAPAPDVRATLVLVARGEAPLGIVYQSDAVAEKAVKTVATFPADTHPPIVYPMALTAGSRHPDALAYVAFLKSDAAKPAFEKQGFVRLP